MPRLEPKQIQRELEQGQLWPVYWLYGEERMKSRELLKRIRKAVVGDGAPAAAGIFGVSEECLDGSETRASGILDAAQSPTLGGGTRLLVIRDAHQIKDLDSLSTLLGPRAAKAELAAVCVFLSRDLDGRRKFSKRLLEKAAVVPCEDVPEAEREAWTLYLAKRKGLELPAETVARLGALDPWSLDIIEQEVEKFSLAGGSEAMLESLGASGGTDAFLGAFFSRDRKPALELVGSFANQPDLALPLLGLISWNVRQLVLMTADPRGTKLNSFVAEKLRRWIGAWKLTELLALQTELAEVDFAMKQTPKLPLGLWAALVSRFCN